MQNLFLTSGEASSLIKSGVVAVIAGVEEMLAALPHGNWIGGTTAYFTTDKGGTIAGDRVFCSVIDQAVESRIAALEPGAMANVTAGRYDNGFTYLLLPAFSDAHYRYAIEAPAIPRLFDQPVIGWVTGVHLADLGQHQPKVFDGRTGIAHKNAGMALHVELPPTLALDLEIANPFVQGNGPAIVFPTTGFAVGACTIDGQLANFDKYLTEHDIDRRLPLVANCAGAMINVSVQAVDMFAPGGEVRLYAPVVAGETYRFAHPVTDYAATFAAAAYSHEHAGNALACNCILNFLYGELDGKTTGGFIGPVTFGEIAYILLNQTLVVLRCRGADAAVTINGHVSAEAFRQRGMVPVL